MGNGGLQYKNEKPQRVDGLPRICRIATGYYHMAALAENGEWFFWGCNEQLQLASSIADPQIKTPQPLSKLLPELKDTFKGSCKGLVQGFRVPFWVPLLGFGVPYFNTFFLKEPL